MQHTIQAYTTISFYDKRSSSSAWIITISALVISLPSLASFQSIFHTRQSDLSKIVNLIMSLLYQTPCGRNHFKLINMFYKALDNPAFGDISGLLIHCFNLVTLYNPHKLKLLQVCYYAILNFLSMCMVVLLPVCLLPFCPALIWGRL
jgi:hypothetical protein